MITVPLTQILPDFVLAAKSFTPPGGTVQLLPSDPTRYSLILQFGGGATSCWAHINRTLAASGTPPGFDMAGNRILSFPFALYPFLAAQQWWINCAVGGVVATIEIFYRPVGIAPPPQLEQAIPSAFGDLSQMQGMTFPHGQL